MSLKNGYRDGSVGGGWDGRVWVEAQGAKVFACVAHAPIAGDLHMGRTNRGKADPRVQVIFPAWNSIR